MVNLLPLLLAATQMAAPIPPEIENEQILGINKEPWHATLMPYGSFKEALAANRHKSTFARSLNGQWKFHYVQRPEQRPVNFYRDDFDDRSWKTIPVPSNWQIHGYGTPYYRNAGYTFQRDWPRVMSEPPKNFTAYEERNPVGSYRRTFEVPKNWGGRQTFLTFDGVDSAFFLWINGQKVGYSQNSRNPAEFDVTKYLKPGKNLVAAEVYRYSSGSYFEDQDMWRLSGIFRNVTLWSAPKLHIRDFTVKTELDEAYRDASVTVNAEVKNYGAVGEELTLDATLYDAEGRHITSNRTNVPAMRNTDKREVTLSLPVQNPWKWSAEKPNLYTLVIKTVRRDGTVNETLSTKVGFREVEIKGRVFTVNGQPVKLKGANRHEHYPDTGHYVSEARMIEDIKVLKQANCNHVRTCHYSDDPRWYELCDQYGIYLVAEANVECHGLYGVLDREPRFEKMIVDRNVANTENFKNHPSVLIWSLGNENGGGSNFRSALKAVKDIDQSRPVFYEPFGRGANNPADIDSHMYTDPAGTERIGQDNSLTKPFYLCEYAHAMNNSMGSIGEYNDIFDKYPSLMGGAIWEWQDQGLWNRRDPKRPYLAYGGGFGDFPNDGYFIHKGVVFSDRSPKPHFPEVKRAYQWIGFAPEDLSRGRVKIKNKFAFTNLSEYDLTWTLMSDGAAIGQGKLAPLDLAPGRETVVDLPIPKFERVAGAEYWLNVRASLKRNEWWEKQGYPIAQAQFEMPGATTSRTSPAGDPIELRTTSTHHEISGRGFRAAFDRTTGDLSVLESNGKNILLPNGGPRLHLWRAEHRNDDGYAARDWNRAGLKDLTRKLLHVESKRLSPTQVQVTTAIQYTGKAGFSATHNAVYTVYGDGSIAVDNSVSPSGPKIVLARVGVRMLLDRGLSNVNYLARGPMENYSDRKRGSDIGLYSSSVADQLTPYSKPMEAGNHEDMRWLTLGGKGTPSLTAKALPREPLQFSALPYTDEELDVAPYRVDLPASRATVLCLSAKTLGVGSNSCGPRPLPQYMVDSSPAVFSYVLTLAPSGTKVSPLDARAQPFGERVRPPIAVFGTGDSVSLAGPGKLDYIIGSGNWIPYTTPFTAPEGAQILVRSQAAGSSIVSRFAVPVRPASAFLRVSASSHEPGEGEPENAIDGDPSTYWHSRWNPKSNAPHSLTLELRRTTTISAVKVTPRQDMSNGRIRDYELYLSEDGQTWGDPVRKGAMPDRSAPVTLNLTQPRRAKFIKLVVLTDHSGGGNFGAVGEIEIVQSGAGF